MNSKLAKRLRRAALRASSSSPHVSYLLEPTLTTDVAVMSKELTLSGEPRPRAAHVHKTRRALAEHCSRRKLKDLKSAYKKARST